ncbi:MAG: isocitrate lyase/phosphoenolpyruvate mutase family protein [Candidatus Zixiibacteriota bacterium]
MDQSELKARAQHFLNLHHEGGMLILPNAWDVASAVMFEQIGASAIATTSAGISFSRGYDDGEEMSREVALDVVSRITRRVKVPVTADLEAGYGRDPKAVAETIRAAMEIGVVGANIEDGTKGDVEDKGKELFDLELAVARIKAARAATDKVGVPFVVNARIDTFYRIGMSEETIAETIKRGNAYAEAGARSVFVFPVSDPATIRLLVKEVQAPVNLLVIPNSPSLKQLEDLGVRRVTFGSALARAAWSEAVRLTQAAIEDGTADLSRVRFSNADFSKVFGAK